MRLLFLPLCIVFCVFSSPAMAELFSSAGSATPQNSLSLDVGVFANDLEHRGDLSNISTVNGFVRVRRGFAWGKRALIEPGVGALVPWRSGVDGSTKTFTSQFDASFGYHFGSAVVWRVGPGVQTAMTFASAQAVVLRNGNSTSTFYSPGGVSTAVNLTLMTGFGLQLSRRFSLNADFYALCPLSSERRTINLASTLGVSL